MEAKTADTAQALANIQDENADISTEQKTCYYVSDEQGSVRYVVDESGAVLNRYQYDAFGVTEAEEEACQNRLRYNGQVYDTLTGQYYLRARYYQPDVGRFTQEDVLYADGLNLYAYCKSNPVMYCDPSGLQKKPGCEAKMQPESEGAGGAKGYSNFADGMSPEDAARYMADNEAKFYSEFSERASKAGLNSTQISEAYNAMKSGDYAKMASYFDTSSPYNGAVFWSGDKTGAGQYATSIGGTLMEQTPGGQVFDNWNGLQGMYNDWGTGTTNDQKPIWEALSSQYANGANGVVTYVHLDGYYGNVWKNTELPILNERLEDGLVSSIQEVIIGGK